MAEKRFQIIVSIQGTHDKTLAYPGNVMVSTSDNLQIYASRQAVPEGIEITNTTYWRKCIDVTPMSSAMTTQTAACKTQTDAAKSATTDAQTAANNANNAVISDDVRIVISESLAKNAKDIEALGKVVASGELGDVHATNITSDNIPQVCGMSMVLMGTAAPTTVPDFAGQIYIDTVNSKAYIAVYNSSVANWKQINNV